MTSGRFDTGTQTSVEYGCKNIKTSYPQHLLQYLKLYKRKPWTQMAKF
jgi:hypothetical protein